MNDEHPRTSTNSTGVVVVVIVAFVVLLGGCLLSIVFGAAVFTFRRAQTEQMEFDSITQQRMKLQQEEQLRQIEETVQRLKDIPVIEPGPNPPIETPPPVESPN